MHHFRFALRTTLQVLQGLHVHLATAEASVSTAALPGDAATNAADAAVLLPVFPYPVAPPLPASPPKPTLAAAVYVCSVSLIRVLSVRVNKYHVAVQGFYLGPHAYRKRVGGATHLRRRRESGEEVCPAGARSDPIDSVNGSHGFYAVVMSTVLASYVLLVLLVVAFSRTVRGVDVFCGSLTIYEQQRFGLNSVALSSQETSDLKQCLELCCSVLSEF